MMTLKSLALLASLSVASLAQAAKLQRVDEPTSPMTADIEKLHKSYAADLDTGSQFSWTATFDITERKPSEKWSATIKQAVHQALSKPGDYTAPETVEVEKPFYLSSRLKKAKLTSIIEHGFNLNFIMEQHNCDRDDEVFESIDGFIFEATHQLRELALEDNRILVALGEEENSFGNSKFVALVDLDAGQIFLFGLGYAE